MCAVTHVHQIEAPPHHQPELGQPWDTLTVPFLYHGCIAASEGTVGGWLRPFLWLTETRDQGLLLGVTR